MPRHNSTHLHMCARAIDPRDRSKSEDGNCFAALNALIVDQYLFNPYVVFYHHCMSPFTSTITCVFLFLLIANTPSFTRPTQNNTCCRTCTTGEWQAKLRRLLTIPLSELRLELEPGHLVPLLAFQSKVTLTCVKSEFVVGDCLFSKRFCLRVLAD